MVTGALAQAQRDFPGRKFHVYNVAITAVRTERRKIEELANILAERCNKAKGPVAIVVPLGGFSAFDSQEGPLQEPEAPHVFSEAVKRRLKKGIPLQILEYHINDPGFSLHLVHAMEILMRAHEKNRSPSSVLKA